MNASACIMPDPIHRWIKGTQFSEPADEYTSDGTCVGVGTMERIVYARSCGVVFASPLPPRQHNQVSLEEELGLV